MIVMNFVIQENTQLHHLFHKSTLRTPRLRFDLENFSIQGTVEFEQAWTLPRIKKFERENLKIVSERDSQNLHLSEKLSIIQTLVKSTSSYKRDCVVLCCNAFEIEPFTKPC